MIHQTEPTTSIVARYVDGPLRSLIAFSVFDRIMRSEPVRRQIIYDDKRISCFNNQFLEALSLRIEPRWQLVIAEQEVGFRS
jgi:hypothetical protein